MTAAVAPGFFNDEPVWVITVDRETFEGTLVGATDMGLIVRQESEAPSDGHAISSNFWLPWSGIARVEQHLHHRSEEGPGVDPEPSKQ